MSGSLEAMARLLCAKFGDQNEMKCRHCGGADDQACWSWFDFEEEARAVMALAINAIAHTGKVDPFTLADAGVAILGGTTHSPDAG